MPSPTMTSTVSASAAMRGVSHHGLRAPAACFLSVDSLIVCSSGSSIPRCVLCGYYGLTLAGSVNFVCFVADMPFSVAAISVISGPPCRSPLPSSASRQRRASSVCSVASTVPRCRYPNACHSLCPQYSLWLTPFAVAVLYVSASRQRRASSVCSSVPRCRYPNGCHSL